MYAMDRWSRLCWLGLALLVATHGFAPFPRTTMPPPSFSTTRPVLTKISFKKQHYEDVRTVGKLKKILDRMDTLKSAGFTNTDSSPLMMRGLGFKRIAFWLFVGFMYKWYRARFINKIPVWDRQPQWNMVITSREQEKDLKAYTCKNCGSTLFIAKNRDWFFEGDTGLGGLGCYTCGAKGKDNFVMDRDRILEDVGEDDDYFDYERPLDFVTAAERRALLKRAKGDEDVANQMLIDQANAESSSPPEGAVDAVIEKTVEETKKDDEAVKSETDVTKSGEADSGVSSAELKPKKKKKKKKKKRPSDESDGGKESDNSLSSEVKQSDNKGKEDDRPTALQSTDFPPSDGENKSGDTPNVDETKKAVSPSEKPLQRSKEKTPKQAAEPPKKEDDDSDPWDDLDALGI